MIRHRIFKTRWGYCGVVASDNRPAATFLPVSTKRELQRRIRRAFAESKEDRRLMPQLVASIRSYFEGRPVRFDVRLDLDGMPDFRRRVLEACRRIPRGRTATYADLARAAGSANAARAVGSAMANNPLPLIVPCHRVVRSDGTLGGFSSPEGVGLKRRLLQLEGAGLDA